MIFYQRRGYLATDAIPKFTADVRFRYLHHCGIFCHALDKRTVDHFGIGMRGRNVSG